MKKHACGCWLRVEPSRAASLPSPACSGLHRVLRLAHRQVRLRAAAQHPLAGNWQGARGARQWPGMSHFTALPDRLCGTPLVLYTAAGHPLFPPDATPAPPSSNPAPQDPRHGVPRRRAGPRHPRRGRPTAANDLAATAAAARDGIFACCSWCNRTFYDVAPPPSSSKQDHNFHRSLVDRPWRTSLKPLDVVQVRARRQGRAAS